MLTSLAAAVPAVADEPPSTDISQEVFNEIYEEVKTPYEYGLVLKAGEQIADFDSELTDQMNVFSIPGDDEYVYTTYVGKDINRRTDGTDNTGYSTGLARSKDMVTWEKLGKILEPGKSFYNGSAAGYMVKEHVWGELPTPKQAPDGRYAMTVLATDQHGYEAGTKRGGVAFTASDSLFNADGTAAKFTMHPEPILDGSAGYESNIIWAVKTIWDAENERYVAFYNAAKGPEVMAQAYSTDLISWEREEANPVLEPFEQPNGEKWGTLYNGDADVVKVGDHWVMFYFTDTPVNIGGKIKPNNVIDSFAVSTDMVTWHKSNIKLRTKASTPYNRSYAHKPAVVKKNGVVYHYYNAVAHNERHMALATSVDLSPVREAKHVLENSSDALLAELLETTQSELIRNGGSLEDVTEALTDLRLYLHPEADSTLMNATVSYNADGLAHEVALAPAAALAADAEQVTDYAATIPSDATNVRLFVTPSSPHASVTIDGRTVHPNAGSGIAFDSRDGAGPLAVTITSRDRTSSTAFTMTVHSEDTAPAFADVPAGAQFADEISWLAKAGISTGWELPDGSREFRPLAPIARDAMAAFLYREAGSPDFTPPTESPFSDVSVDNLYHTEIAWLAEQEISTGWEQEDGTSQFRPLEPITRDAMAAFLHRAAGSPEFEAPTTSPFADVTPATQYYTEIAWMHATEISTGWPGEGGAATYRPLDAVNRDAMAAFLHRFHHDLV